MTGPGELNIEEAVKNALAQSLLASQALSYNNTGTTTADYTVFDEDIAIDFNGTITIQILLSVATTAQVKLATGGAEYTGYVNSGNSLAANSWYEFDMNVNAGDSINFIVQVPAGDTLTGLLRVFRRER